MLVFGAAATSRGADESKANGTGDATDHSTEIKRWSDALEKDPKDATAYFNRGNAYEADGDHDHALSDFSKAIDINPQYADAYVARAVAGIAQEESESNGKRLAGPDMVYMMRWEDLNAALKIDPKNTRALLVRGDQYLVVVQYKKALADFEAVIGLDPGNTAAFCGAGRAYEGLGEMGKALADYTEAIRLDPKDAAAYRLRAMFFVKKAKGEMEPQELQPTGRADAAKAVADYGVEIRIRMEKAADKVKFAREEARELSDPESMEGGDCEMQEAYWGAVAEADPKNADAWYHRGHAEEYLMQFDAARADYAQAIKLDPGHAEALKARANLLLGENGGMKEASADFDALKQLPKGDAGDYIQSGVTHQALGEYAKAMEDYNKAIQLDPRDYQGYERLGETYADQGDWKKAIANFNVVVRLLPDYDMGYNDRGKAYYQTGDWDGVIADFTREIKLEGKDEQEEPVVEEGYVMRAGAWSRKGMYDKAIADYNRAVAACKNDFEGLDAEAWFYATCPKATVRNGGRAVELALKACTVSEWNESDTIDTLAAAYAEAGKWEEAVKFEKMALKMAGDVYEDEVKNKDSAIEALNGAVKAISDDAQQVRDYTARLALYQQKKPCREDKGFGRW